MIKKLSKWNIIVICVVVVCASVAAAYTIYTRSIADNDNPLDSFPYKEISVNYNNSGVTKTTGYIYNDGMLLFDARNESKDLSKASVALAAAAYSKSYAENALGAMDFSVVKSKNYTRKATLQDNDFVAYTIAKKEITYKSENYCYYCIVVRGTPGSAEWFSNFNLGKSGTHEGFNTAAEEIIDDIKVLASDDKDKDGNVYDADHSILWVTGHSRGASVANLVAGKMTEEGSSFSSEHIFGYTYACPAVSKSAKTSYKNIYNYNDPGDAIPEMPMESWGYKRYGQSVTLGTGDYDNFNQRFYQEMNEKYSAASSTDSFIESIDSLINNESQFSKPENKLLFAIAAKALADDFSCTSKELLEYVGYEVTDELEAELDKKANTLTSKDGIASIEKKFQDMYDFLQKAYQETEGLNDEEVKKYIASNQSTVDTVENYVGYNINDRATLLMAMSGINDNYLQGAVSLAQIIGNVSGLFIDMNGNPMTAITHGHMPSTYVLWINSMFYGYKGWYGYDGNKEKPDSVDLSGYDIIGVNCFYDCDEIDTIKLSDSTRYMGYHAFYDCDGITQVTIPVDFDYTSGTRPFEECSNVTKIRYTKGETGEMPDTKVVSGGPNFQDDRLEYSVRNSLNEAEYEEGITKIGANTYYWSYYVGKYSAAKLKKVTLPESLKSIGAEAFRGCTSLSDIVLPKGVGSLGSGCFRDCVGLGVSMSDLGFPASLTNVSSYCFSGCKGLKGEVEIPKEIKSMGFYAFYDCDGITQVTIPVDFDYTSGTRPFEECSNVTKIRYTKGETGEMPDTKVVSGGPNFQDDRLEYSVRNSLNEAEYEEGITKIGANTYYWSYYVGKYSAAKLKKVTLPESLKSIGAEAFRGCTSLSDIVLPKGVGSLGQYTFYNDTGITHISIPISACYSSGTFSGCSGIKHIDYTEGTGEDFIPSFGYKSTLPYYAKDNLETVIYKKGIKNVQENALKDCKAVKNIALAASVETIPESAFETGTVFTVYGIKDTAAESFAEKRGVKFIPLDEVIIYPEKESMHKATNQKLEARIYSGIDKYDTDVVWTLEGEHDKDTGISSDGILTIGEFEKTGELVVKAVSGEKSASVVITVLPNSTAKFTGAFEAQIEASIDGVLEKPAGFEKEDYVYAYYLLKDDEKVKIDDSRWPITIEGDSEIFVKAWKKQHIDVGDTFVKEYGDEDFDLGAKSDGDGKLTYHSQNTDVVTVSEAGIVSITGRGSTKITVSASQTEAFSSAEKIIMITVNKGQREVPVECSNTEIMAGQYLKMTEHIEAGDIIDYESSDENVIATDETGKIKGIGAGKAELKAIYKGNDLYRDCIKVFDITVKDTEEKTIPLSECSVTLKRAKYVYDGYAKEPKVEIYYANHKVEESDYIVFYRDNVNPGKVNVTIFAVAGSLTGSRDVGFEIKPLVVEGQKEIGSEDYAGSDIKAMKIIGSIEYIGKNAFSDCEELSAIYFYGNAPQIEDSAFSGVTATAYYPASDKTWKLSMLKGYGGNITWKPWDQNTEKETKRNLAVCDISTTFGNKVYSGNDITADIRVIDSGRILSEGNDYTVEYRNNVNVGVASLIIKGIGDYEGEYKQGFEIEPQAIDSKQCKLSTDVYTYNGRYLKPTVVLKDSSDRKLGEGDYMLTYKNNRDVGTASVKITGTDNYSGTFTKTFKINPKGTSVTKLVKAKKAFTVNWKKQSMKMANGRITGYQLRYSIKSSMSGSKLKTVKGYSKTNTKVTKLKAKKKYYVQVRTYRTVGGKNYYSAWSTKKSIITK